MNEIKREVIKTKSEDEWLQLRTKDITSTESAALFGLSPYVTPYELWHRKKEGAVVPIEPNERMKWGTRLQDSIAKGIAEDQGWKIKKRTQYERLPEFKVGASFDFTVFGEKKQEGLLEIKNVDPLALRSDWIIDGDEIEAPPHIELQVQHQLLVSGLPFAYIGALVGGNRAVLIKREPLPEIIQSIIDKTEQFWKSIETGNAPKPNFAKDAEFVVKLNQQVKAGKAVDMSADAELADLVAAFTQAKNAVAQFEAQRDEMKARILTKIGDAEKVSGSGFTISAGTTQACKIPAFQRPAYRNCRVTFKKPE